MFEFDRYIGGNRVRARKYLPKTWSQAQADTFDRAESARLYAVATDVSKADHTIADAVAVYVNERLPEMKSRVNVTRELGQMYWAYEGKKLSELAEVCRTFLADAGREREGDTRPLAPATLRNRIRQLTSACRYAWKHHGMGDRDPAAKVAVPEVRNERQHYASRAQMLALSKACSSPQARMAVRIGFYSGMRLGEILRAKIVDGNFSLSNSKNRKPRMIPIHPRIWVCVRRMNRETPKITIQRSFMKARKTCDLDHLHFHDLRHSAASEMVNAGLDLYTAGRVLGHTDMRSTQRYAHLATDTLREAIGKIGQKKGGLVKKSPTTKQKASD